MLKWILLHEEKWCQIMGYKNPYLDPYDHHITSTTVTNDQEAYRKFPENKKVYDKLWIAKTQNLNCGKLEELIDKGKHINYPIFIKPRWGHLSAASKHCYKIKNREQLDKYVDYPNMMWSEFIEGTEGMTDILMINGRMVYQLTYKYSDEQNGFSDVWKYISPKTKIPPSIEQWARDNIENHTGFVNIQYRTKNEERKIIEVGLRPARGGMYLIGADCPALSKNIYNAIDKQFWDDSLNNEINNFEPYYSYKCFLRLPLIYILPQKMMDSLLNKMTDMPLYEYYFEPVNHEGVVFFQFMHRDHKKGLKIKKNIELLFNLLQIMTIIIFLTILYSLVVFKSKIKYIFVLIFILLWLTRFLTPLYVNYNCYKAYRQMIQGKKSLRDPETFV